MPPLRGEARGAMRPDSDIDIMVEFKPGVCSGLIQLESLAGELESLAGCRVDPNPDVRLESSPGWLGRRFAGKARYNQFFKKLNNSRPTLVFSPPPSVS